MLQRKRTRLAIAAIAIFAFANITIASNTGEGETRKKASSFKMSFTPSKVSVPFTLKNNLRYEGSHIISYTKTDKFALYSSVMTYRKGNVVYMIPVKQKVLLPRFIKQAPEKN